MKLFIIFVLALAITVPVTTAHRQGQRRIYNGKDARLGQFGYQARIRVEDDQGQFFTCGGSLISPNYILTVAHCLKNKVNATVYLGAINRYRAKAYRDVTPLNFIVHDRFNNDTLAYDIALIKIPTINLTRNIWPAKLRKPTEKIKVTNMNVIVSGWGRDGTSKTEPLPKLLKWTRLKVISNMDCRVQYGFKSAIRNSNMCANSLKSRVCVGDSGGPVVLEKTKELVAIVSWGNKKRCETYFPSVFVRIKHFLQWIKDNSDVVF